MSHKRNPESSIYTTLLYGCNFDDYDNNPPQILTTSTSNLTTYSSEEELDLVMDIVRRITKGYFKDQHIALIKAAIEIKEDCNE
jgi:hypothetical protein